MPLTEHQEQAIRAEGDVLVLAGAGAGKTRTLVERCLNRLLRADFPTTLDRILMVTFTDAAAAEMRQRIRLRLQAQVAEQPANVRLAEQLALLDTAPIGTLHRFCLRLVRDHFHELQLDPQLQVLDEAQSHLLATEALDALLQQHYAGTTETNRAVQDLIDTYGRSRDDAVRALVRHVHTFSQTLPDPEAWLMGQKRQFEQAQPPNWLEWLLEAILELRNEWLAPLRASPLDNLQRVAKAFARLPAQPGREEASLLLETILEADKSWDGQKTKGRLEFKKLFEAARFLEPLARVSGDRDPLVEDWSWLRPHMLTLTGLVREFATGFAAAKRQAAALDFHDLEQFALRLLWDRATHAPSAIARQWRARFDFVFVDEYQDINAAQDRIITALSRESGVANRFLVGDVKQCIYRFRLANPHIFQRYADAWGSAGSVLTLEEEENRRWPAERAQLHHGEAPTPRRTVIPLAENFRSREAILEFINRIFAALMRREVGGVEYGNEARLHFGAPETRAALTLAVCPAPAVELQLQLTSRDEPPDDDESANLTDLEREARHLAVRLRELKDSGFQVRDRDTGRLRACCWADMVVLLRAPGPKAATFAQEFARAGVPLSLNPGSFYEETEVTDLISLLQLLDNPLQDVPVIAVLRSPIAGLTLDELARARLALPHGRFWNALECFHEDGAADGLGSPAFAPFQSGSAKDFASSGDASEREARSGANAMPFNDRSPTHAKVTTFLESYARWRLLARQASLSQCLETILDETHYEDWLLAQPDGEARRTNVQRLLALTRRFDVFQRQGLHRFQRFVEAQREADAGPEPAAPEAGDSLRLMSIHKSKGLEFPIVAVADLGGRFNLSLAEGGLLMDEDYGLCAMIKPPDSEQRYPSLPFWLANRRERRELLGEELRLLYVAMTRACDRLILSGTVARATAEKWTAPPSPGPLPTADVLAASSPLRWLGPLIARLAEDPRWLEQARGTGRWLTWQLGTDAPAERASAATDSATPAEPGKDAALQSRSQDSAALDGLRTRLSWRYEQAAATRQPAKGSVTSLRRPIDETDDEARPFYRTTAGRPRVAAAGLLSAAARGAAHHKFLQYADLARATDLHELRSELARLVQAGFLRPEESVQLDLHGIATFWKTDLGRRIRDRAPSVRRELEFTARFSVPELRALGLLDDPGDGEEFVVIQGVADLVAILPEAIWLVDFKTDHLDPDEVATRMVEHERQLRVYALALERIYQRPVKECAVYFLALRRLESIATDAASAPRSQ